MNSFFQQEAQQLSENLAALTQAADAYSLLTALNDLLSALLWGTPMILLMLGTGIWLTVGNRFVQVTHFGTMLRHVAGSLHRGKHTGDQGSITPFQAVATALSASLGTGNISGVAVAISTGGPGAVFWMWVSALFGMATKYTEILLAQTYRHRDANGEWTGGPMWYMARGLPGSLKRLAVPFSLFCACSAFGIGNLTQVNSLVLAVDDMLAAFTVLPAGFSTAQFNLYLGIGLAALLAAVLKGGMQSIGRTTALLVPFMAGFYLLGTGIILLLHAGQIPAVLHSIFAHAFGLRSVFGGAAGYAVARAVKQGFARGIFSNEAGLGSAPIAHASANAKSPAHQGLYGIFEVFFDTFVICTITALVILLSKVPISYGETAGTSLVTAAFATVFGQKLSALFMVAALGSFCFSTLLGWSFYGVRCVGFLFGKAAEGPYMALFVLLVVAGAVMDLKLVWSFSDTMNAAMAIPNLIALAFLGKEAFAATRALPRN